MLILKGLAQNQKFSSVNFLIITIGNSNSFATETLQYQTLQTLGAKRASHPISSGSNPHHEGLPMPRAKPNCLSTANTTDSVSFVFYNSTCYQYCVDSPAPKSQEDKFTACVY